MNWIRETIEKACEDLRDQMQKIAQLEEAVTVGFVFANTSDATALPEIIAVPFECEEGTDLQTCKMRFAHSLRAIADKLNAQAVAMGMEVWMVVADLDSPLAQVAEAYSARGELHNCPLARERLLFMLNWRDGTQQLWEADILSNKGLTRRIGPWVDRGTRQLSGGKLAVFPASE